MIQNFKSIIFFFALSFVISSYGQEHFLIVKGISGYSSNTIDRWETAITNEGHVFTTILFEEFETLDLSTYDVVIYTPYDDAVSGNTHYGKIKAFIESGKNVYIQTEWWYDYESNLIVKNLFFDLGVDTSFVWGTDSNSISDYNYSYSSTILSPLNSNSNAITNTYDFFYLNHHTTSSSDITAIIQQPNGKLAGVFYDDDSTNGKLISIPDKDWIGTYWDASYIELLENIVHELALSTTLSVKNQETTEERVVVFPNPTSSILNIDYDFKTVKVFDLTGRKILESNYKTIDISELPNSIYLLKLYDASGEALWTTKVIKK